MLIKQLFCLMFFLSAWGMADAQVSLVLQVPPVGVMQKNQLWNMALVASGSVPVSIQLTLVDAANGQPVMTAATRTLQLSKGANAITAKDVAPVQYDYLSPLFTDRDPNGFLPAGNFKACYTVILPVDHGMSTAEDCIPVEVQPLSPPQLNSPPDTSVVETAYPQFSWLPPTPVNLFSELNYQMILVEVLPDQGSYQAIQENIPVYNISHLQDPVNLYPSSAKPLDTGKLYAWRVLVLNQDQYIDQSEVWTFKLATPKATPLVVPGGNYISLRSAREHSAGVQLLSSDTIGIRY
ncbi:MAG TPA: hypothetical protein VHW43_07005, partial [Puia sp.]|nr:hypothetical protein [Puia sp.]